MRTRGWEPRRGTELRETGAREFSVMKGTAREGEVSADDTVPFRNLGLALKTLREIRGLSTSELASRAKAGKGQLSGYETGNELPKLDTLGRLLGALDCNPRTLFHVVHLLDQLEAGELEAPFSWESSFAPIIAEAEQEAFVRLIKDTLGVFAEQVAARTLWAQKARRKIDSSKKSRTKTVP